MSRSRSGSSSGSPSVSVSRSPSRTSSSSVSCSPSESASASASASASDSPSASESPSPSPSLLPEAPLLEGVAPDAPVYFDEGGVAALVSDAAVVVHPNAFPIMLAVVAIASNGAAGDVLQLAGGASALPLGVTAAYDADAFTLTVSGGASAASYTALLRAVQFVNGRPNPSSELRQVTFVVSDGVRESATLTALVVVVRNADTPRVLPSTALATTTLKRLTVRVLPSVEDDAGDTLAFVFTNVTGGTLALLDTTPVVAGSCVSVGDAEQGVVFTPDGSVGAYGFSVVASGDGVTPSPSSGTVFVAVTVTQLVLQPAVVGLELFPAEYLERSPGRVVFGAVTVIGYNPGDRFTSAQVRVRVCVSHASRAVSCTTVCRMRWFVRCSACFRIS